MMGRRFTLKAFLYVLSDCVFTILRVIITTKNANSTKTKFTRNNIFAHTIVFVRDRNSSPYYFSYVYWSGKMVFVFLKIRKSRFFLQFLPIGRRRIRYDGRPIQRRCQLNVFYKNHNTPNYSKIILIFLFVFLSRAPFIRIFNEYYRIISWVCLDLNSLCTDMGGQVYFQNKHESAVIIL